MVSADPALAGLQGGGGHDQPGGRHFRPPAAGRGTRGGRPPADRLHRPVAGQRRPDPDRDRGPATVPISPPERPPSGWVTASRRDGLALRYAWGARPRKAVSRSLGSAVAATGTGAANSGCRPSPGISSTATASRSAARAGGIGSPCPHARDTAHPSTAISMAPAAATMAGGTQRSAIAL